MIMAETPVPRRRRWLNLLRWGAVVYLLVVLTISCTHVTDRLILFPTTAPVNTRDAVREMIPVPGRAAVEVWRAASPGARHAEPLGFMLYFVGNADRADRWATFMAAQWGDTPIEVYGMNYPGFGGSPGPARLEGIAPAAGAVYDALRARAGKRPIFVQGNSLGTTAALYLLATRDVAFGTLHNPPALREVILGSHGWWNLWLGAGPIALTVPGELDSVANARRAKAPALFILSEQDEVVPVRYQRKVYEAYGGQKQLLVFPHTHNTGMDDAAWNRVNEAVARMWREAIK